MIHHDNTCDVTCTDNDKTVSAEVAHFRPNEALTIILATNKINMKYQPTAKVYVGSTMGMEFISKGPKYYETKQGRF